MNEKVVNYSVLERLQKITEDFVVYHKRVLPLCAAENVVSDFANLPMKFGFQERYIMNNTYSFNMDDNFIGCEKLYPYYEELSAVCKRLFGAEYSDARPLTGMQCIDMVLKTVCKPGDKLMILSKAYGGHASVQPVAERLGLITYDAPYNLLENDLDYSKVNEMIRREGIQYVILCPSDLIKPLDVEQIDTTNCVLMWDCTQIMGLIAAGLCRNPLKTMKNIILLGGTHKTIPGPVSGLIMTNEKYLHERMETTINPKYLRNIQIHEKISLLFTFLEFEQYGRAYMEHMLHCSRYLGQKLRDLGFNIVDIHGDISSTHQIHILTTKEEMELIYHNAEKCEVTLNKKHKALFKDYGIRLGTQEIARYNWDDNTLDKVASIINELRKQDIDIEVVKGMVYALPEHKIHFTYPNEVLQMFDIDM